MTYQKYVIIKPHQNKFFGTQCTRTTSFHSHLLFSAVNRKETAVCVNFGR